MIISSKICEAYPPLGGNFLFLLGFAPGVDHNQSSVAYILKNSIIIIIIIISISISISITMENGPLTSTTYLWGKKKTLVGFQFVNCWITKWYTDSRRKHDGLMDQQQKANIWHEDTQLSITIHILYSIECIFCLIIHCNDCVIYIYIIIYIYYFCIPFFRSLFLSVVFSLFFKTNDT